MAEGALERLGSDSEVTVTVSTGTEYWRAGEVTLRVSGSGAVAVEHNRSGEHTEYAGTLGEDELAGLGEELARNGYTTVVNRRTSRSPGVFEDHSLLGNYFNEGIARAEVKLRHGQALAATIGRATARRYRVAFTTSAQRARLAHWRGIRDAELPGSDARERAAAEVEAIDRDLGIPEAENAAGRRYVPTP